MSKIVITIEDLPGNKVSIRSTPSFSEVCQLINSGHVATSAHGYAMAAINLFRRVSQDQSPQQKILIPRVARV